MKITIDLSRLDADIKLTDLSIQAVFDELGEHATNKEVASELLISEKTITRFRNKKKAEAFDSLSRKLEAAEKRIAELEAEIENKAPKTHPETFSEQTETSAQVEPEITPEVISDTPRAEESGEQNVRRLSQQAKRKASDAIREYLADPENKKLKQSASGRCKVYGVNFPESIKNISNGGGLLVMLDDTSWKKELRSHLVNSKNHEVNRTVCREMGIDYAASMKSVRLGGDLIPLN